MTDGDALLRAVIDSPDDDTPRLVYADWLEDHGQSERAEFIRLQVEVARAEADGRDYNEVYALRMRAVELQKAHKADWLAGVCRWKRTSCFFERGFVGEVWCSVKSFVDHGAALLDAAPVRTVGLRRLADSNLIGLDRAPHFRRVRRLKLFRGELRHYMLGGLLNRVSVAHLRGLAVAEFVVDGTSAGWHARFAADAAHIAQTPDLAELEELDLSACGVGDAGGRALAESRYLRRLRRLTLRWNPMSELVVALLRDRFGDRLQV
ncbi:MAG: TIGR02996 domain-containing protein [Gemmataceae bacterium]|nr:TIGR02996 domain-containing protein [Gemmataceae bacterium]